MRLTSVMRDQVSDEDLAKTAAFGDERAFSVLLERHYDRIYRVAYRVVGTKAEAEDITQDVCMGLGTKLSRFKGTSRLTTWLHSVTINAARDHMRRRATHSKAASIWGEVEVMRRAEASESAEAQDWLQTAMTSLSPSLRETVALILGEDCTQAEAAEALGVSEGTIAWRMAEVKKALAAMAAQEETS